MACPRVATAAAEWDAIGHARGSDARPARVPLRRDHPFRIGGARKDAPDIVFATVTYCVGSRYPPNG